MKLVGKIIVIKMDFDALWQMEKRVASKRLQRECVICDKKIKEKDEVVKVHTDGWSSVYSHYNCFLMALKHKFPEIKIPKSLENKVIIEML